MTWRVKPCQVSPVPPPMYLPFISFIALAKSMGSIRLTNPNPLDLLELLSFTTSQQGH